MSSNARTRSGLDQYKRAVPAHMDMVLLSDPEYGQLALQRVLAGMEESMYLAPYDQVVLPNKRKEPTKGLPKAKL
jgi:hypothetical protein